MRHEQISLNHRTMCVMTEILMSISLFHTVLCMNIPAAVNLNISSEYFVHLLSWSMGAETPDGVHYTVSMRTLSDSKRVMVVEGCEKVTSPLQCNLTQAFSDPEETYYTSVSAVLGNRISPPAHCRPFKPILNTTLESPLVSLTVCNTSLCVSLRAPSSKLHSIYNSFRFDYSLMISGEDGPEFHKVIEGLQDVTLNDLTPSRRYCVTVSINGRTSSSRPAVCASIPKTVNISVSDVLLAVFLCLLMVLPVMCVILSYIFCLKVDLPAVLNSFQGHYKVKVLLTTTESINNLTEDTDAIQKMKKSREADREIDRETEEGVMYERLATQHLKVQDTSSSSALPESSGSGSPVKQSSGSHASLSSSSDVRRSGVYDGGRVIVTELTCSQHLPEDTRSLLKSAFLLLSSLDGEERAVPEDEDVNLCSVMIPGVMMGQQDAETCANTGELELMTDSTYGKTALSLSSASAHHNIHMSDCEQESQDEDSGYLSRA